MNSMIFMLCFLFNLGIAKQSMNIHMLTHLPHFVRLFGPLWNFSCFGFESMNAHLKSMIHGTRHINHQISCAISMTRSLPGLVKNIIKRTESDDTKRLAKLLSSKITMGEKDDEKQDAQVLGKRRQLKADDPTVEQFQLHGLVHKFFRCATDKGHRLWSAEYQRCKIRNSYTISFIYNDATRYGSILYFIDNEDKLFAVVKLFNVSTLGPDGDFSLVSDRLQKYRGMIFKHIILVTDSKEEILLPVDHIHKKCIQISINNVMYIAIPPNQFEHN
ncbi:uncharacterized protein LOC124135241 [Haliotis rufescens]|uniref:uncharacterized protein LOC124135241 n=1 Tax=Haliotis rufescens TaxID=6454 RepID=UPI00201E77B1|nr:uncharacterized protein LOC124135241 [Haliotis rufescens]